MWKYVWMQHYQICLYFRNLNLVKTKGPTKFNAYFHFPTFWIESLKVVKLKLHKCIVWQIVVFEKECVTRNIKIKMKGKKGHKTGHLLVSRRLNQKMNKRWKSVKVGGVVEGPCSMTSSLCPKDAEMYGVSRALCRLKS